MGTRSSRLPEESVCGPLEKDGGVKRESFRRIRGSRPSSLALDFSSSFDRDSEAPQSRSEEGSDSDTGRRVSPTDGESGSGRSVEPESGNDDGSPGSPERFSSEEEPATIAALRASAERMAAQRRHSSGRNSSGRAARVRSARPVSEAWLGLYRVRHSDSGVQGQDETKLPLEQEVSQGENRKECREENFPQQNSTIRNTLRSHLHRRHFLLRCPFCTRTFPGGRIEEHLLTCLTSPPLPYNTDVLSKDSGECSICLEELLQGDTIARLACLCVYHKKCIDSWSSVKPCCPEHPFN